MNSRFQWEHENSLSATGVWRLVDGIPTKEHLLKDNILLSGV